MHRTAGSLSPHQIIFYEKNIGGTGERRPWLCGYLAIPPHRTGDEVATLAREERPGRTDRSRLGVAQMPTHAGHFSCVRVRAPTIGAATIFGQGPRPGWRRAKNAPGWEAAAAATEEYSLRGIINIRGRHMARTGAIDVCRFCRRQKLSCSADV